MSKLGDPDDLADRGLRTAAPALRRLAQDINAHAAASHNLQAAADTIFRLLTVNSGELIQALADETFLADLQGRLSVDFVDMDRPLADYSKIPAEDAITFFKNKKLMSGRAFKKLRDEYKQRAFAIAGLNNQHGINAAHGVLTKAIKNGTSLKQGIKDLKAYTSTTIPNHAEIVFRNNVIGAHQAGRWQQLQQMKDRRPYWQYSTAGDDRVRDDHAAMNGKIYNADSPVWDTWYPPNGHQCRCSIISMSKRELERENLPVDSVPPMIPKKGKKPARRATPDKGWAVSPASVPAADKAMKNHRSMLSRQKMLLAPKTGRTGSRAYITDGDIGGTDTTQKAGKVDRFAGLSKSEAIALGAVGAVIVGKLRRLKKGETEARVPIASQYADGTDQLLRRVAGEPATAGMIGTLRLDGQSSYVPGAGAVTPELVAADGMTRGTESVVSLVARNGRDAKALAASVLNAEAGHGAPIRRAVDAANIIIRGNLSPVPGYTRATLNHRKLGSKREIRITKKPLLGFTSEQILVTIARAKDLL